MAARWVCCPRCSVRFQTEAAGAVACPACTARIGESAEVAPSPSWYVVQNKQKIGPLTVSELRNMSQNGRLKPEDMVLQEGTRTWVPAGKVAGLFEAATVAASQGVLMARPAGYAETVEEGKAAGTVNPPSGQAATVTAPPQVAIPFPKSFPSGSRGAVPVPQVPGYEIVEELGRGGMGVVFKARQTALKRLVALKMILSGGYASSAELTRFLAEAQAVARLQHQNIVQIYEIGEKDSLPFFSLEYVAGGTLAKRLAGTPLIARDAAQLTATIALAIEAAHQSGIVHRDLKPANVLLAGDASTPLNQCVPKVADFGLAKTLGDDSGQTRTGVIMGTPSYMSPEQARGLTKEIGPRTDVYALGAMLYEMLTGRPPFRAATAMETMEQVRSQEPVSPRTLQPSVPRDLETVCMKCLTKDREARYATAREMAEDLQRYLSNQPILARPASPLERTVKYVKRNRLPVAVASFIIFLLVIGIFTTSAQASRARKEKKGAEEARREAEEARLEAEEKQHKFLLEAARNARLGGDLREQIRILKIALKENPPDSVQLRLDLARAYEALAELVEVRTILDELEREGNLGKHEGSVMLLRGYMTMGSKTKAGFELIRKALSKPLPRVEEQFARGLLAPTTDEAIGFFRAALKADRKHAPSWGMLGLMLFMLGRIDGEDGASEVVKESLFHYPDHPASKMLQAVIHARNGNKKKALQVVEDTRKQLSDRHYRVLKSIVDFMEVASRLDDPDVDVSEKQVASMWLKLAPDLGAVWPLGPGPVPLDPEQGAEMMLALPPVLGRSLGALVAAFAVVVRDLRNDTAHSKLDDALRTHPEGTLYFVHGALLYRDDKFKEAARQFHTATRAPCIAKIRRRALSMAILCESKMAIKEGKIVDAGMLKECLRHIRDLEQFGPLSPNEEALALEAAQMDGDLRRVEQIVSHWEEQGVGDQPAVLQARMRLDAKKGEHVKAFQTAERLLAKEPKNAEAAKVRAGSLAAIKKIAADNK